MNCTYTNIPISPIPAEFHPTPSSCTNGDYFTIGGGGEGSGAIELTFYSDNSPIGEITIDYSNNTITKYGASGLDVSLSLPLTISITGDKYTYTFTFVLNTTPIFVATLVIRKANTVVSQPVTGTPVIDCKSPYIHIDGQVDNTFLQDVVYVAFTVGDCKKHECGLGIYNGYTQSIKLNNNNNFNGTIFYLVELNIGDSIIGVGTYTDKAMELSLTDVFLTYALLKFVLGRLVFGEFDLKWLFRDNYKKLIRKVSKTIYRNTIPYLLGNSGNELYFKYSQDEC